MGKNGYHFAKKKNWVSSCPTHVVMVGGVRTHPKVRRKIVGTDPRPFPALGKKEFQSLENETGAVKYISAVKKLENMHRLGSGSSSDEEFNARMR